MATKSGGEEHSNALKKIGKLQEKAIRVKFLPNDASVTKKMKELKILKLKDYFETFFL